MKVEKIDRSFLIEDIKKSIATASALGLVIAITSIIFMYVINLEIFYSKIISTLSKKLCALVIASSLLLPFAIAKPNLLA